MPGCGEMGRDKTSPEDCEHRRLHHRSGEGTAFIYNTNRNFYNQIIICTIYLRADYVDFSMKSRALLFTLKRCFRSVAFRDIVTMSSTISFQLKNI